MSKQNLILLLSFALIAIFTVSFFNLYQSAKIEQNVLTITKDIHLLRIQNILIREQISNDFKRQNYDKLNQLMDTFLEHWKKLNEEIGANFSDKKEIVSSIALLDNDIKNEQLLYMSYESDKAVLANSVFFLVKIESDIRHNSDPVSLKYSELINTLLKDITYFNVGLTEIEEDVKNTIVFMETHKLPANIKANIVKVHLEMFFNKSSNIFKTIDTLQQIGIETKLNNIEKLFFEVVNNERDTRKSTNILVATLSFLMLLGFLITFFKTYRDKEKILLLQKENEHKNNEIIVHMQLLNEYKKALDESSIVSKTDLNGFITYVNDNFCTISGYAREELIGRPHNIVRHEDMSKEIFYELWQTIKNQKVFHRIIKNKKKNEESYYVDSTIVPILDVKGDTTEYFAVRYDVTELIKAKEEALAAEKAKSAFLATMSHELRTPLNAVIGFSQIMLMKNEIDPETLKTYIHKINVSGKNLLNIINNILDFSKIESQKMDITKTSVDLNSLIDETILLIETSAYNKHIHIIKQKFEDIAIEADNQLLKQAILNILSNAIKFTPENKNITIAYKFENKSHIISICDEGVGLTPEQIKTIFQPFSQIIEHQNEAIKGTGLGLAICQKIVELHNGSIQVTSEIDKGSCFMIQIPLPKDVR